MSRACCAVRRLASERLRYLGVCTGRCAMVVGGGLRGSRGVLDEGFSVRFGCEDARMEKTGVSSTMEWSPAAKRRWAAKRRREEKRWAKKCGPVIVRFDPSVIRKPTAASQSESDNLAD